MDIGYFAFPAVIASLVFFIPCQQPFLGSILLAPSSCQISSPLERLGLATLEFAAFHYMTLTMGVFTGCLLFAGMLHLWLDSSKLYAITELKLTRKYRELQIYEKLFNSCVQGRIFPVIVSFCPVVEILGGFACIRLREGMNILEFAFICAETTLVTVFTLFFFSGAGMIYTGSVKWLRDCKSGETNRVNRKVLASLTPLKVRFGQNFVDGLTPLVLQEFCTVQMINLLLLY